MKKMYLVLVAVVMAVSFSAFTVIKKAPSGDFTYHKDGQMVPVPPEVDVNFLCPEGDEEDCRIEIEGQNELIYLNGTVYRWE